MIHDHLSYYETINLGKPFCDTLKRVKNNFFSQITYKVSEILISENTPENTSETTRTSNIIINVSYLSNFIACTI